MLIRGNEAEEKGLMQVAELMCVAARTAPKGRGVDIIEAIIVTGDQLQALAEEMRRWGQENEAPFGQRDAGNLEQVKAAVLLGAGVSPRGVPGCGFCGFGNCAGMEKSGGLCAISSVDLGIAIGSAVSVATAHHVDNRVMFSVGRAAVNLKLFMSDVKIAFGIPLSVSSKSPFFDRPV